MIWYWSWPVPVAFVQVSHPQLCAQQQCPNVQTKDAIFRGLSWWPSALFLKEGIAASSADLQTRHWLTSWYLCLSLSVCSIGIKSLQLSFRSNFCATFYKLLGIYIYELPCYYIRLEWINLINLDLNHGLKVVSICITDLNLALYFTVSCIL